MKKAEIIQLYDEINQEKNRAVQTRSVLRLDEELGKFDLEDALYLGTANDGLPVLLRISDPTPKNITFLSTDTVSIQKVVETVAACLSVFKNRNVEFAAISSCLEFLDSPKNCVGIFSSYERGAQDLLLYANSWMHSHRGRGRLFLLIDDVEPISNMDFDTIESLKWILVKGAQKGVWPILFTNPEGRFFKYLNDGKFLVTQIVHEGGDVWTMIEGSGTVHFRIPEL